jgi:hypothetical protein
VVNVAAFGYGIELRRYKGNDRGISKISASGISVPVSQEKVSPEVSKEPRVVDAAALAKSPRGRCNMFPVIFGGELHQERGFISQSADTMVHIFFLI